MNRRAATARRCPQCRMVQQLCICALLPRIETRTRVVIVVHHEEAAKPTNTGLLAARCLAMSRVVVTGVRDRPMTSSPLGDEDEPAALLFPSEDALAISTRETKTLVVPDGTWRQARKMRSRVPGLAALPCVTLTGAGEGEAGPAQPTAYRLRTERREGGLATLEAIARALAILEGERGAHVERAMLEVFRVMVDRTLWLRGALRDDEVTGGIPEAARAHDPRGGLPHVPRVPRA